MFLMAFMMWLCLCLRLGELICTLFWLIANNWKSKIDNLFIQPQILEIGWMDKREWLIMSEKNTHIFFQFLLCKYLRRHMIPAHDTKLYINVMIYTSFFILKNQNYKVKASINLKKLSLLLQLFQIFLFPRYAILGQKRSLEKNDS